MEASKATRRSKEALAKTLIAGEAKYTAFSALYNVSPDSTSIEASRSLMQLLRIGWGPIIAL